MIKHEMELYNSLTRHSFHCGYCGHNEFTRHGQFRMETMLIGDGTKLTDVIVKEYECCACGHIIADLDNMEPVK